MDNEKGKGDGPPNPSTASFSQTTDGDSSNIRNAVYKYCTSSSKTVEPGQLCNILKQSFGDGSLNNVNNRISNIEVTMNKILNTLIENKAENKAASYEYNRRIENCEGKISKISETVPKLMNMFSNGLDQFQVSIQAALDSFEDRMMTMEKLQLHHLLKSNTREQRSRAWSLKIHNYINYSDSLPDVDQDLAEVATGTGSSSGEGGGQQTRKIFGLEEVKIFKTILLPALQKALAKGEIRYLPSEMDQIVETAHKSGGAPGQPPSYLFRFYSRPVLYALLRNKFDALDALNKANLEANPSLKDRIKNGSYREVRIGCDLTSLNRSILTFLHKQDAVKLAKVSGDKLIFQLHAEPNRWRTVLNPYATSIFGLSQPPADVNHYVSSIFTDFPPYLQDQRDKSGQQLNGDDGNTNHVISQDANIILDSNRHNHLSSGFLTNHTKNKSRLSKAVSSIKKDFDAELSRFTKEIHSIREAQVSAMETTANLMEDLTAALTADTKQVTDASDTDSESSTGTASITSILDGNNSSNQTVTPTVDSDHSSNQTTDDTTPAGTLAAANVDGDHSSNQTTDDTTPAGTLAAANDGDSRGRDRSTSVKRPITSPHKPRSNNKKQRKSNRKRQ